MSNDEAINILIELKAVVPTPKYIDALNKGIEALRVIEKLRKASINETIK